MVALLYIDVKVTPIAVRRYERGGLPGRVYVTNKAELKHINDVSLDMLNTFLKEPEAIEVWKGEPEAA